jgi:hypothetical protein
LNNICEDNIRIDIIEAFNDIVDWISLTQDKNHWLAIVNIEIDLQIPQQARNF